MLRRPNHINIWSNLNYMNLDPIPNGFQHVGNCIRPPSKANAILLRATLGCSHSRCTFCGAYGDKKFAIKEKKFLQNDIASTRTGYL